MLVVTQGFTDGDIMQNLGYGVPNLPLGSMYLEI